MRIPVALALGAALFCSSAGAFETAFWVWQRSEPLSEAERAELAAQNVRTIYWQIGELENVGQAWRWKARFTRPRSETGELKFVPVIRLESRERSPFSPASLDSLLGVLSPVAKDADELQLDYDAPDRLLADYAAALRKIHTVVPRLSITALPGWSRDSVRRLFERSVDELLPMLYDFEPDPIVEGAAPLPLVVPEKLERSLGEWDQCRIPWRPGLPAFARLTLFDPSGKSRGHIREWSWDALCFDRSLATLRPIDLGVTLLRPRAATRVANTPVNADQLLAVRWPDRAALMRVIDRVKKTSARGVVFFRMPDSSAASGWSLRQLGHLEATPHLVLRQRTESHELELVNESDADLEPRLSSTTSKGELDRGYALELDAPAAIFRDAQEGDFWRLIGHVDPDGAHRAVTVPLATRLTFWFSHLRARQSWRTGVIHLAPGESFDQIRYRIRNSAGDSEWKSIAK
ncbi:MAG: hypothetical protein DME97_10410 [Verrucomicrobia bacterium]|nr:MAG: hypothetical protein DME97_10410 [Verrucomicrobiota bacterium]